MSTKYTNPISITSARKIVVQQPVDDRGQFNLIADVTASIVADEHYNWFEYMLSYIHEIHEVCAWLGEDALPNGVTDDDLVPGTVAVYPTGYPDKDTGQNPSVDEPQYGGRTFGFYRLRAIPVEHVHVESDITDLDKYTQAQVDAFLAAKQNSLPANTTGNIAYLTKNAANNTFSWVVLSFVTAPNNTGDTYGYVGTGWEVIKTNPSVEAIVGQVHEHMYMPQSIRLAPGTYDLVDPTLLPQGFTVTILHDSSSSSQVNLQAHQVDNYSVPLQIPQHHSITLMIDDGRWRRIDRFIV